jgi:hypothetical protein
MRRTLSSRTTILWNYVLPVLVIAGLSCVLLLCWLGKIKETDGRPMSVEGLCWGTLFWAFVVWGTVGFLGALKRVEVDDAALYVSNYFTEVRIPLSEVRVVRESGGYKDFTKVTIGLRSRSAFGKTIEFLPRFRLTWSGTHPAVRELRALRKQASGGNGVDQPTPFDPTEKIYEAPDDSVVQVGKDYVLYGCEGKDEVCEKDKFFFKDLTRITLIRARKSGRITAIDYKVKRKSGTFEIGGYKPEEMEEIARLLETRAKSWPIQFLEKQVSGSNYVALFISGLGAIAATICSGWLLHFGWTVRDQLSVGLGLLLFAIIFLPTLGVAAFLWFVFWDNLRD